MLNTRRIKPFLARNDSNLRFQYFSHFRAEYFRQNIDHGQGELRGLPAVE